MNQRLRLFHFLFIFALFMGACNLPASDATQNIAGTAAAQTVQALMSATPLILVTPSATPAPAISTLPPIPLPLNTNTPAATATSNCNVAQFIADITIPDKTIMTPGHTFAKKWRIKNVGSCAWNGFVMVFDSGDAMGGPATTTIAALAPGQEVDLEVNLTAPSAPGNYRGYWRINTNSGVLVPIVSGYNGRSFYVDIIVQNATTATPTATLTATNTSSAPVFAVTGVSFVNTGGCGSFTATANITTNAAGIISYVWKRSDGAIVSTETLDFASAETLPVSYTWSTTAAGAHWIDIYIDSPNHQQFGRAAFTCP